jgi:predicted ester cyclase
MSTETTQERIHRGFNEFVNQGDLTNVSDFIAPNYIGHFSGFPPVSGLDGFRQFLTMQNDAFSDRSVTFEDVIAEDENVAVRLTFRGTHTGELMGIPPTGRKVEYQAMNILHLVDDKCVEQWAVLDTMRMMQQLGVIPAQEK